MTACPRAHRGSSLVELLVALPIAMVAATAAAMLIVRLARTTRMQGAELSAVRELRHALTVLREDLEPLEPRDLVAVTDSLLEFRAHVGLVQLCEQLTATAIIVAVPPRSDDVWLFGLRSRDMVRAYASASAVTDAPVEHTGRLSAPPVALGVGRCGVSPFASPRRFRLVLADSFPALAAGSPVLLQRAVRYQHYRSGGSWWLGRRTHDGLAWEGLQPVAGPLRSAAQRGVEATAIDANGLPVAADSAVAVRLVLRAERRTLLVGTERLAPLEDSARMDVVLRATIARRPAP